MSNFIFGILVGYMVFDIRRDITQALRDRKAKIAAAKQEAAARVGWAQVWADAQQLRARHMKDFTEGDGR